MRLDDKTAASPVLTGGTTMLLAVGALAADDEARLGRTSVWEDKDGEEMLVGQKLLNVDGEEVPLLEFRSIVWNSTDESEPEPVNAAA